MALVLVYHAANATRQVASVLGRRSEEVPPHVQEAAYQSLNVILRGLTHCLATLLPGQPLSVMNKGQTVQSDTWLCPTTQPHDKRPTQSSLLPE